LAEYITGYMSVFEERLRDQKVRLNEELQRAKSDRRKEWLREEIGYAKKLRDLLKKMKKKATCPHCGGEIDG